MNLDTPNLKSVNTIAYDKTLRDYLKELRNTLSEGLMDISVSAMKQGTEYKFKAIEQLKFMSKLTSEFSRFFPYILYLNTLSSFWGRVCPHFERKILLGKDLRRMYKSHWP